MNLAPLILGEWPPAPGSPKQAFSHDEIETVRAATLSAVLGLCGRYPELTQVSYEATGITPHRVAIDIGGRTVLADAHPSGWRFSLDGCLLRRTEALTRAN
jgi:hypothetical protein